VDRAEALPPEFRADILLRLAESRSAADAIIAAAAGASNIAGRWKRPRHSEGFAGWRSVGPALGKLPDPAPDFNYLVAKLDPPLVHRVTVSPGLEGPMDL
jgi:hypothetical protein